MGNRSAKLNQPNIDFLLFNPESLVGLTTIPELFQIGTLDDKNQFQQIAALTVQNCCNSRSTNGCLEIYDVSLNDMMTDTAGMYLEVHNYLRKETDRIPMTKLLMEGGHIDNNLYGLKNKVDIYVVYKTYSCTKFKGRMEGSDWFEFECKDDENPRLYAYSLIKMGLDDHGKFIKIK